MCYTLIDKLEKAAAATNIATVGYQTLFSVLANGASGAANYTGTKAEADAIVNGTTVNVSESSDGKVNKSTVLVKPVGSVMLAI